MGMERFNKKLHIARRGVVYSLVLCCLILLIGGVGFWLLDPHVHTLSEGLWLAFTGRYGDKRDRGAYIASALNDGPFFSMLFLGASGLGSIPFWALLGAVLPFILGMIIGNLNPKWREIVKPTAAIVIPFFAFPPLPAARSTSPTIGPMAQTMRPPQKIIEFPVMLPKVATIAPNMMMNTPVQPATVFPWPGSWTES